MNSIRKNSMKVCSIHADFLNSDISDISESIRINGIENIKRRIDTIKKINSKIVIVHPGGCVSNRKEQKMRIKGYTSYCTSPLLLNFCQIFVCIFGFI